MTDRRFDDDDGRIIADMSGVGDRPPMLIPKLDGVRRNRAMESERELDSDREPVPEWKRAGETVQVDPEARRAMIGGALTAGLLVVGVIAAAFAVLIVIIGHVWG